MKNITEVVDSIIDELDGRRGFEFGDIDEDILDEIKDELVKLILPVVSFELPSDEIFDMPEVHLKNPLEEFYYYERPAYLKSDQRQFRERLEKALNYLKGN